MTTRARFACWISMVLLCSGILPAQEAAFQPPTIAPEPATTPNGTTTPDTLGTPPGSEASAPPLQPFSTNSQLPSPSTAPPPPSLAPPPSNVPPPASTANSFATQRPRNTNTSLSNMLRSASWRDMVRVPEMLGDYGVPGAEMVYFDRTGPNDNAAGSLPVPIASGLQRLKIADFNKATPQDRLYATYHHYHNVSNALTLIDSPSSSFQAVENRGISVDRWVLGAESTLESGRSSIEIRIPIGTADDVDLAADGQPFSRVTSDTAAFGNASIILKRVAKVTSYSVWAYGLGIETPTGDDATVIVASSEYEFDNNAVHLSPFLAYLRRPSCTPWFIHGFAQLDIPLSDNDVTFKDRINNTAPLKIADYDAPVRLLLDGGIGRWLHRPTHQHCGIAFLSELHLVTNLEDGDEFAVTSQGELGPVNLALNAPVDTVLNASFGLHLENTVGWHGRLACNVPIADDRFFDTEIQVQVGRRF